MKKTLILLVVVGMLISAGGCTVYASPLLYVSGAVLVPVILKPDLVPPTEQRGGAWLVNPNEPDGPNNLEF